MEQDDIIQSLHLEPVGRKPPTSQTEQGSQQGSGGAGAEMSGSGGNERDTPRSEHNKMPSQYSKADPDSIANAEETLQRTQATYGREEQDELLRRQEETGARYRDNARSAEQQAGNYPYQFMNLAKENPRGNLNRVSYNTTLRFSRLADKLNNRLHWNPGGAAGVFTGLRGQQMAPSQSSIEKWDPIETEEMRQMAANRRLDERARQAGVDLQSRIQAYPQDLQELGDRTALGFENELLSSENSFMRGWQNAVIASEYTGSVATYYQKNLERYMADLNLADKTRIADYLLNTLEPWAASYVQYLFGSGMSAPVIQQRVMEETLSNIYSMEGFSSTERAAATASFMAAHSIPAALVNSDAFTYFLTGDDRKKIQEAYDEITVASVQRNRKRGYNPGYGAR